MPARMLINGQLVDGARTIEVIDPGTGGVHAICGCADAAQIDAAVAAAAAAFPKWRDTCDVDRRAVISECADRLEKGAQDIASLLSHEQGKPLAEAFGEVMASVGMLRFYAGLELDDEVVCDDERGRIVIHRAPLGVVVAITPWNSPVLMMANKVAPALRAGNTVVCKPAATTPLSTVAIGALWMDCTPAGVVNFVVDANDLGDRLTSNPAIAKISFTGSTATGRRVMAGAADRVLPLTLELGGNDAAIVLDDADIDVVAPQLLMAAMRNAGQVCLASKRAYVPSAIYDAMCARLAELAKAIKVGHGHEPGVEMGPIQNRRQFEKVLSYLDIARRDGVILAGGEPLMRDGFFIAPTIVADIAPDSPLVTEEQFGPILPVVRYDDIEDVIAQVNASAYGLGGTIWTGDVRRGEALAARIESGIVWINRYMDMRFEVPIGGVKASGLGVEMGRDGLLSYMRRTVINAAKSPG